MGTFFIDKSSKYVFQFWLAGRTNYIIFGGFLLIGKASFEPRDYRVVFVIQKSPEKSGLSWWRLGDSNPRSVTLQISFSCLSFVYAYPVDRLPPSNTYNHHNIFTNHLFYLTQKLYQIHDFYSHVQERCKGYISRVCFYAREHQKENKKQINMRFCLIKTAYIWRRVWDSNSRAREGKRFSRPPRYDHFDNPPCKTIKFLDLRIF